MIYKVIQSNSKGNAVLYFGNILVDVGVSYKKLAPYKIDLVLISHYHNDHLNYTTLKKLQYHNPNLIIVVGEYMLGHLKDLKNIYVIEPEKWYDLGQVKIRADELNHDVPNFSFKIVGKKKIFHATDTKDLKGIVAKNYDIYALEHNYCEDKLNHILATSTEYEHGYRSIETHMSDQYASSWANFMADKPEIIKLHVSSKYGKD